MVRKRGRYIVGIIDAVMVVISIAAIISLAAAYLSPLSNPNKIWYFAFFGLFAPIIYIINFVIALYWACRWSLMFFLSALFLLIGSGNIPNFYRLSVSKKYGVEQRKSNTINIFTFNVEGFIAMDKNRHSYSTAGPILDYIKQLDPDIICFQEYQSTKLFSQEKIDSILGLWPHKTINYSTAGVLGTATYSKYPILSSGILKFEGSNNSAIYSTLQLNNLDTLRVINNHLETTYIDRGNIAFLDYHNFSETDDKKTEFLRIGRNLRKGFERRATQADSVAKLISQSNLTTIVCGDFNDTPLSYVYRKIKGDYRDSFREKGEGIGYTYKRLYKILRIDYVLHSNDLEAVSYDSPYVQWSDHNPVMVSLKRK